MPIAHVREVMRRCPVEPVALAPHYALGVAVIRGESVPVIDAGLLLEGAPSGAARFVVLRVAERSVALAVDDVSGTRRIDAGDLDRLPPLFAAAAETVQCMAVLDGQLVEILESGRLIEAADSRREARESAPRQLA